MLRVIDRSEPNLAALRQYSSPQGVVAQWYVAQTCAHHEKRVSARLSGREIENFLPLYERTSQWKDRRVCLQVPLFAGYVFVRLSLLERLRVLEVPGVVRLVGFGELPVPVPEAEVEGIRNALKLKLQAEPCSYLEIGEHVRIIHGPLRGIEGVLVRKKSGIRFVLSVALIQRSIAVEVNTADISPVRNSLNTWLRASRLQPGKEKR